MSAYAFPIELSQDLRHIPLRYMTPAQCFVLEMQKYMTDIRAEANRRRTSAWKDRQQSCYLVGRLHGLRFGLSSYFIYHGRMDLVEWSDVVANEADFLTNEYQEAA